MRKHSHYFKDVRRLTEIDVYRTCELFGVDDPSGAVHHAVKKLLLAGGRGAGKDYRRDLQEAIDTLKRKLEMMDEDLHHLLKEGEAGAAELTFVGGQPAICPKCETGAGPCYCHVITK